MTTRLLLRSVAGCVLFGGLAWGGASAVDAQATSIDAWKHYCVATFAQDFEVPSAGFGSGFAAKAGDEYLITRYFSYGGRSSMELLLLTPAGPKDYELRLEDGAALPFKTACDLENTTQHVAVFANTPVFKDATLKTPMCELSAGAVRPMDPDSASGHSLADADAGREAVVYEVWLNAYRAECGGAESGFVRAPAATVRGTSTFLVPIRTILGPA